MFRERGARYGTNLQTLSGGFLTLGITGAATGMIPNYLQVITFFQSMAILRSNSLLSEPILARAKPTEEDWKSFRRLQKH